MSKLILNPLNFLNGIIHLPLLELSIIIFGIHDENLKLVSQQYRALPDCMDVQAGLALYWWQRLITLSSSRVRVNEKRVSM